MMMMMIMLMFGFTARAYSPGETRCCYLRLLESRCYADKILLRLSGYSKFRTRLSILCNKTVMQCVIKRGNEIEQIRFVLSIRGVRAWGEITRFGI